MASRGRRSMAVAPRIAVRSSSVRMRLSSIRWRQLTARSPQVRIIRTEDNAVDSHHGAQHRQYRIAPGECGVEVEVSQRFGRGRSVFRSGYDPHLVDDREPPGEIRHGPTCVGEDVLHVGSAGEGVCVLQMCDRPGGICGEVDERIGQAELVGAGVWRGIGVDEHDRPALLQLLNRWTNRLSPR